MGGLCWRGYLHVALPAFSNLFFLVWRHLLFSSLLRLTHPGPMCLRICSFSVLHTSHTHALQYLSPAQRDYSRWKREPLDYNGGSTLRDKSSAYGSVHFLFSPSHCTTSLHQRPVRVIVTMSLWHSVVYSDRWLGDLSKIECYMVA